MVDEAAPGAYCLVMTHSHALDLEIVERILRRGDYGFLGLIGSETEAAKFRARLTARGVDPANLLLQLRDAQVPVRRPLEGVAGA